jgi:hypothetical protein
MARSHRRGRWFVWFSSCFLANYIKTKGGEVYLEWLDLGSCFEERILKLGFKKGEEGTLIFLASIPWIFIQLSWRTCLKWLIVIILCFDEEIKLQWLCEFGDLWC